MKFKVSFIGARSMDFPRRPVRDMLTKERVMIFLEKTKKAFSISYENLSPNGILESRQQTGQRMFYTLCPLFLKSASVRKRRKKQ